MRSRRDERKNRTWKMQTVKEIETAIQQLSDDQLRRFRSWFENFEAARWDRQFEEDVAAGRLDSLAEKALKDLREGRCTDL